MTALQEIFHRYSDRLMVVADAVGEVLRAWAFVGEGFGCYTNFDIRIEFEPVTPGPREFKIIMGREPWEASDIKEGHPLDAMYDWSPDVDDKEVMQAIRWYRHPNGVEMGWYWDGDGALAFYVPELEDHGDDPYYDGTLINTDCKKSQGWEFGTFEVGDGER